jgi:hypothetical protein
MMVLDSFWSAVVMTLALSGALFWIIGILVVIFYWLSGRSED